MYNGFRQGKLWKTQRNRFVFALVQISSVAFQATHAVVCLWVYECMWVGVKRCVCARMNLFSVCDNVKRQQATTRVPHFVIFCSWRCVFYLQKLFIYYLKLFSDEIFSRDNEPFVSRLCSTMEMYTTYTWNCECVCMHKYICICIINNYRFCCCRCCDA